MAGMTSPRAGAGSPRQPRPDVRYGRRVGSFLVWWVLLMSLWVWIDDSLDLAELVVGAAVAALGALLAELAQYQSGSHIRIRFEWLLHAWKLPGQVVRDTGIIFAALWRTITSGHQPPSGFRDVPVQWGDESPEGDTRRTLLIAATSVAPNTFALGLDQERNVMVVHQLVPPGPARRRTTTPARRRRVKKKG
jgi:multisubunit Na+/H+ antiporter MnhE subunit